MGLLSKLFGFGKKKQEQESNQGGVKWHPMIAKANYAAILVLSPVLKDVLNAYGGDVRSIQGFVELLAVFTNTLDSIVKEDPKKVYVASEALKLYGFKLASAIQSCLTGEFMNRVEITVLHSGGTLIVSTVYNPSLPETVANVALPTCLASTLKNFYNLAKATAEAIKNLKQ